jgi:hypothetical protein
MNKKFNYTGVTAQAIDAQGYWYGGGNYGTLGPNGYGPMGGPAGNNIYGYAQQFEVEEPITLRTLNVEAVIGPGVGSTTFSYKLYLDSAIKDGNAIPQDASLALTSAPLTYNKTFQEDVNSSIIKAPKKKIAFEFTLQPGTYWLAQEGEPAGGPYVYVSQTYEADPAKGPVQAHKQHSRQ